jgi:hypothetical protein
MSKIIYLVTVILFFTFLKSGIAQTESSPKQDKPYVVKMSGDEFLKEFVQKISPFEEFALVLGRFYQLHDRWPRNSDLKELKAVAREMAAVNPKIDLEKYKTINLQEQSDGSIKVKYRLNSESKDSEMTLKKPHS